MAATKDKRSPTYRTWDAMVHRCTRPKATQYKFYGGRGIKVCDRWLKFANFLADVGERPPNHSLDRFPNKNGNYEPGNVRWATMKEQSNNTRSNRLVTAFGRTMSLSEWGRETGIGSDNISYRLSRGWSIEDALTKPIGPTAGARRGSSDNRRKCHSVSN